MVGRSLTPRSAQLSGSVQRWPRGRSALLSRGPSFLLCGLFGCAGVPVDGAGAYREANTLEDSQKPLDLAALQPKPGQRVSVLSEHSRYQVASNGAVRFEYVLDYEVLSEQEEELGTVEATYAPDRQLPPEIEVTLFEPSGSQSVFGEEAIRETQLDKQDAFGFAMRRRTLSLPPLKKGTKVRQTVRKEDLRPLSPHASGRAYFGLGVAVPLAVVELAVPETVLASVELQNIQIEPVVSEEDGMRIFRYEVRDLSPNPPRDELSSPGGPPVPYLAFTTAPAWEVALETAVLQPKSEVEEDLPKCSVDICVGGSPRAKLATAVAWLRGFPETRLGTLSPGPDTWIARVHRALHWLNQQGVAAKMALARQGPKDDLRPNIPSVLDLDRVLIRAQVDKDVVWLDPMSPFSDYFGIESSLHGRWAVVIESSERELSAELELLPRARSESNRYYEHRHVQLPDFGRARIVETTKASGDLAARLRSQLNGGPSAIVEYVSNQYNGRLGTVQKDVPPHGQVEVAIEALRTATARTELFEAKVNVDLASLFGWLPPLVRDAALVRNGDASEVGRRRRRRAERLMLRTEPAFVAEPYVAELVYEIEGPDGFDLVTTPKNQKLSLGPGEFSSSFYRKGRKFFASFRFESGPQDLSADELRQLVLGLRRLWSQPSLVLQYKHASQASIEAKDHGEALRILAEETRQHPKRLAAKARLSLGLLQAGFGRAARLVIASAVDERPESVMARLVEGQVLAHDLAGRRHGPGFDRAGAIEAFRTVKVLDPARVKARAELAQLRAMNDRGIRHADRAGLEATVAELRSLRRETGVRAFDNSLLEALFHAKRDEELLRERRRMDGTPRRDGLALAARVRLDGDASGAKAFLRQQKTPERAVAVAGSIAAAELARVREYGLARSLVETLSLPSTGNGAVPEGLDKLLGLKRTEDNLQRTGTPRRAVQNFLRSLLTPDSTQEQIEAHFSMRLPPAERRKQAEFVQRAFRPLIRQARGSGVPYGLFEDSVFTSCTYSVVSEAKVHRVRVEADGFKATFYLKDESDGTRVMATGFDSSPLGYAAAASLEDGDPMEAEVWLQFAQEAKASSSPSNEDECGKGLCDLFLQHPFLRLRRAGAPAESAAWVLAAMGGGSSPQLRLRALIRPADARLKPILQHALAAGLASAGQFQEAAAILTELLRKYPKSDSLQTSLASVLIRSRRYREAAGVVQRRLKGPRPRQARMQLANLELARGKFFRAAKVFEAMLDEQASAAALNNRAWTSLFTGQVSQRDVEMARAANALTRNQSVVELHTLASVLAERGEATAAIEVLQRRLQILQVSEPEPIDYWIIGRIFEHVGLPDLSADAYQRVEAEGGRADDTAVLARRSLRRLRRAL